jgi:hypothetical protein
MVNSSELNESLSASRPTTHRRPRLRQLCLYVNQADLSLEEKAGFFDSRVLDKAVFASLFLWLLTRKSTDKMKGSHGMTDNRELAKAQEQLYRAQNNYNLYDSEGFSENVRSAAAIGAMVALIPGGIYVGAEVAGSAGLATGAFFATAGFFACMAVGGAVGLALGIFAAYSVEKILVKKATKNLKAAEAKVANLDRKIKSSEPGQTLGVTPDPSTPEIGATAPKEKTALAKHGQHARHNYTALQEQNSNPSAAEVPGMQAHPIEKHLSKPAGFNHWRKFIRAPRNRQTENFALLKIVR